LRGNVISRMRDEVAKTQVLVFAGGLGKRMGVSQPKSLVEVAGTTLLDRCIDFFASCDFREFVFLLGHGHREVLEHIGDGSRYSIQARSSVDKAVGGGRAKSLLQALRSGTVDADKRSIITFPDDIFTDESMPIRLLLSHLYGVANFNTVASIVLSRGYRWPYGVATLDESGRVKKFEEKPFISEPTSVGLYLFEPSVYKVLKEEAEASRPFGIEEQIIPRLAGEGRLYGILISPQSWLPVNTQKDLEQVEKILSQNQRHPRGLNTPERGYI
jgi:NDP-sugar pyrophosphorylase family protein